MPCLRYDYTHDLKATTRKLLDEAKTGYPVADNLLEKEPIKGATTVHTHICSHVHTRPHIHTQCTNLCTCPHTTDMLTHTHVHTEGKSERLLKRSGVWSTLRVIFIITLLSTFGGFLILLSLMGTFFTGEVTHVTPESEIRISYQTDEKWTLKADLSLNILFESSTVMAVQGFLTTNPSRTTPSRRVTELVFGVSPCEQADSRRDPIDLGTCKHLRTLCTYKRKHAHTHTHK